LRELMPGCEPAFFDYLERLILLQLPPRHRPCVLSRPRPSLSRRPPPPTPHPRPRPCALPLVARDAGPLPLARPRQCPDTHCSHVNRASLLRARRMSLTWANAAKKRELTAKGANF
jgi:hypothetical protein